MSENGEIYTAGNKFYTAAGTDGMDKFHLWEELCWDKQMLRWIQKMLIHILCFMCTEKVSIDYSYRAFMKTNKWRMTHPYQITETHRGI